MLSIILITILCYLWYKTSDEDAKTISRMQVSWDNQMDREKELRKKIEYLEGLIK